MSKTTGNVVNPLDLVADFGVDGFRYYFLAETPYGNDGDFTYEGLVGRYNSDLANNLGNLLARVATVVGKKCDGIGPAPRRRSAAGRGGRVGVRGDRRGVGGVRNRAGALDATWSLIRATNAHLEANEPWKAEPGPAGRRRAWATPSRRCASSPCSPRRRCPRRARRCGSGSASPAGSRTSASRPRRRGAATPAACR